MATARAITTVHAPAIQGLSLDDPTTRAATLIVGAQGLLALTDSFAPFVAAEMSVWQFHVVRAGMMLPVILLAIRAMGTWSHLVPRALWPVILRTVLNVVALGAYFAVLPVLPLAQAAAGLFTAPIWVVIFLSIRNGTPPDLTSVAAAVVGFAGVALALGAGADIAADPVALVPIGSAALYALSVLVTNGGCRGETPCSLLFWNVFGFFLLGLGGMAWIALGISPAEVAAANPHLLAPATGVALLMLALIAALGCCSILAVGLITRGYQIGAPSSVALFDYSYLIWAALFSALIWGAEVSAINLIGLALILAAGGIVLTAGRRSKDG